MMKRNDFTFIEMLVVIAIVFVLIGMTLASVTCAKRKCKDLVYMNNLRQLSLVCNYYKHDYGTHPIMKRWLDDFRPLYDSLHPYGINVVHMDGHVEKSKNGFHRFWLLQDNDKIVWNIYDFPDS